MGSYSALSVVAPAGELIRSGKKTLEIRTWVPEKLPLRNLLIVQNKIRLSSGGMIHDPDGEVVAIVDVETVADWIEAEMEESCATYWEAGWKAWRLTNLRPIYTPLPAPARLRIYSLEFPEASLLA